MLKSIACDEAPNRSTAWELKVSPQEPGPHPVCGVASFQTRQTLSFLLCNCPGRTLTTSLKRARFNLYNNYAPNYV